MTRLQSGIHRALDLIDRIVPHGATVVMRTFPDFDDQFREVGAALVRRGIPVVVIADDTRPPTPPLDFPCRIVSARSPEAFWRFCRAPVIVHTHGIFGNVAGSPSKRFVNIWHGMPIKRLPAGSAVGRHQTDVTVATSPVHARHLAETWGLEPSQVALVGLPRNDALQRVEAESEHVLRSGLRRPLAVWLPTFRSSRRGTGGADGQDLGTVTQLAGADLERIDEVMGRHGFHALIKPHPAAPLPESVALPNVSVWATDDLRRHGWTLYRLLSQADLLITDVSSVWVDFLLLDRPILFAMSDQDAYVASRGTYFDDLEALIPGRMCTDFDDLERELAAHAGGADPWRDRRAEARALHHGTRPGASAADEVAAIVEDLLGR